MNKFAVFLSALAACGLVLAVSAGSIPDEERNGMKRAFGESSNFFANLIQKNQANEKAGETVRSAIRETRDKFQKSIDANKNAPIPKPTNPEVGVYLHDDEEAEVNNLMAGEEEEQANSIRTLEMAQNATEPLDDSDFGLARLFQH